MFLCLQSVCKTSISGSNPDGASKFSLRNLTITLRASGRFRPDLRALRLILYPPASSIKRVIAVTCIYEVPRCHSGLTASPAQA